MKRRQSKSGKRSSSFTIKEGGGAGLIRAIFFSFWDHGERSSNICMELGGKLVLTRKRRDGGIDSRKKRGCFGIAGGYIFKRRGL
jgi:hypothetical protein